MPDIDPRDALPTNEPASEPVAEPPAAPEPAAPVNPGPWAADLERFPEEVRQEVDAYLRETWQPRVTQLEQRPDLPDTAAQLWNDLNGDNYAQAFLSLTGELFDEDVAQEVLGLLANHYSDEEPPPEPAGDQPSVDQLPPEVQALVEKEAEREYNEAIEAAVAAKTDEQGNVTVPEIPEAFRDLLHPLVVQSQGDVEAAASALRSKLEAAGVLGTETPAPHPDDVPDPPPPVVGDAPPPVVPTQKKQSLEDAIHDFWQEQQKQPPPPVGSV